MTTTIPEPTKAQLKRRNYLRGIKGNRKRTKMEREADFVDVARMYLNGRSQGEIVEWIGLNRNYTVCITTINNDLKAIREKWRERYLQDYDAVKVQELANIDELEKAAWEAWNKSMGEIKEAKQDEVVDIWHGNKTGASGYTRKKSHVAAKDGLGNPQYLLQIERCIKMRISIFGLDAPKTVNVNWRQEAKEAGVENPDEYVNTLAEDFLAAAMEGNGGQRSLGEGSVED